MPAALPSIVGARYGKWTVVAPAEKAASGQRRWECRCDCGRVAVVHQGNMRHGGSRSCGCDRTHHRKHGKAGTPLYYQWQQMCRRCHDPKIEEYSKYGARGITVCDRWRNDFAAFESDMGPRPSSKHTIDRIDNTRGYDKSNCRWATMAEQNRNRSSNVWCVLDGERLCIEDAAKRLGVNPSSVTRGIRKNPNYRGLRLA